MRDPSIHLTESDLILVLNEAFKGISPIKWNQEKLAKKIVALSKRKSRPNRMIYVSNDKLQRTATKIVKTGISETELFSQILTYERKRMRHRGIRVSKIGDPDWLQVKEAASLAADFCNEFELEKKEGFIEYVRQGLSMMKNYSIQKFKTLHGPICKKYECIQELQLDPTPHKTEEMFTLYYNTVNEKAGFCPNYKEQPEKYIGFKRAVDTAKELNTSIKLYLRAQFYSLEWASGIPDPLSLYGNLAKERVTKYAFENGIKIREEKKVNLKKIRRVKYDKDSDR